MKRLFTMIFLLSIGLMACEKQIENIIPVEVGGLPELQAKYKQQLVASTDGWVIDYVPVAGQGSIAIWLKFNADGTANIITDYNGFTSEQTNIRYRLGGVYAPELIFETYSAWHAIAENMGGAFEFTISFNTDGSASLKTINGTVKHTLKKATAASKADVIAKIAVVNLIENFNKNASGYFKNLMLTNISAFFELNPSARTIKLTWLDAGGNTVSEQFTYSNVANGIALNKPWKPLNLQVDVIKFGQASTNEMTITEAGNAGTGKIAVDHVPAFPYHGTADYFIQQNGAVRFYAYTLATGSDYYSPALEVEFQKLKSKFSGATTFLSQLYNHNGTAPNFTNSIQFRYVMPAGSTLHDGSSSGWIPYYYNLTKLDESHVVVTPTGTTNNLGTPFLADVNAFLSYIFPPEGVTIVPYGRAGALQRIRLVSRKDSKYYMMVTVSTPAGVYID
ncbi:DUF4302 domain-containing protein [Pedobacter sp. UBA4863]|uniref:DUF4302 domain-containing protein n=1 Tax=Pedobacter sp. UBA4863 TaxID=1947060 RepID=UPI0025FE4AB1|nr:DUF4302 domain-containing protein [Pedobacter sp. UBA4863]